MTTSGHSAPPSPRPKTVAVIGLGAMGIVAVKNLVEEGFDVTGFERNPYVGGLWHYTDDKNTLSVLPDTQTNVTVDSGCYTDYPYPKGTPAYCSAKEVENYLESYVDHFGLRPHFHLNTIITGITRQDDFDKWRIDIEGQASRHFDKVVMATGPHVKPCMPDIKDAHLFSGPIIHSRAFKKPEELRGRRVVVLGLGNTGGDIADALVGIASSVTLSHNRGAVILPRFVNGLPASHLVTHRRIDIQGTAEKCIPSQLLGRLVSRKVKGIMKTAFGDIDPSWRLDPAPSLDVSVPVVSDTLMDHLRAGDVRSAPGIRRIVSPNEIELDDGTTIEADALICCTGYKNDFGILDTRFDPSANPPSEWKSSPGAKDRPLPRLYRNVFSLDQPGSLAFVGCVWFATGAFCLADLTSMCIAQVWAGKSSLPPAREMSRWADVQERRICSLAQRGSPIPTSVPHREWLMWADRTAGTGVFENLGWGCAGWRFWWRERELCRYMMDGVLAAAMWRVFDKGKRKPWEGAKAEIVRVNEAAREEKRIR